MTQEAEILLPERRLTIGGEVITIHEFTFRQGLELAAEVDAVTGSITEELADMDGQPDTSYVAKLQKAFGREYAATLQLMAACCGRDAAWVEALDESDSTNLLMGMWLVNKDFFMRRLRVKINAMLEARHHVPSALETSSPY